MKVIIGFVMVLTGVALGLYVGVWVCFIGGIVDIINEIRADDLSAMSVAIGVTKIVFASFIGSLSAIVLVVPGKAIIKNS